MIPLVFWLIICTVGTVKGWWNSDGADMNIIGLDQTGELVL